ncbi:MAG: hypothetical protein V1872_11995, partial [bacterium]
MKNQEEEVKRILYSYQALGDMGSELTSSHDFKIVLKSLLYMILGVLGVAKGGILLYISDLQILSLEISKGLDIPYELKFFVHPELVKKIVTHNELIMLKDVPDYLNELFADKNNKKILEDMNAYVWKPMIAHNEFLG